MFVGFVQHNKILSLSSQVSNIRSCLKVFALFQLHTEKLKLLAQLVLDLGCILNYLESVLKQHIFCKLIDDREWVGARTEDEN